jgi:predicted phage tail protein
MRTIRSSRSPIGIVCAIALAWVSAAPAELIGQGQTSIGWDSVLRLQPGERVAVATDSGKYQGLVRLVDPESLSLTSRDKQELLLPRDKVRSVAYAGKHSKLGAALVLGGIGLAVAGETINTGSDLGSLSSGSLPSNHNHMVSIAGLGLVAVGVFALLKGGARTIYKRPDQGRQSAAK